MKINITLGKTSVSIDEDFGEEGDFDLTWKKVLNYCVKALRGHGYIISSNTEFVIDDEEDY